MAIFPGESGSTG